MNIADRAVNELRIMHSTNILLLINRISTSCFPNKKARGKYFEGCGKTAHRWGSCPKVTVDRFSSCGGRFLESCWSWKNGQDGSLAYECSPCRTNCRKPFCMQAKTIIRDAIKCKFFKAGFKVLAGRNKKAHNRSPQIKKGVNRNGWLLAISLASPRGFEPLLPAWKAVLKRTFPMFTGHSSSSKRLFCH